MASSGCWIQASFTSKELRIPLAEIFIIFVKTGRALFYGAYWWLGRASLEKPRKEANSRRNSSAQQCELDRPLRSIWTKLDEGDDRDGRVSCDHKIADFCVNNYAALKQTHLQRDIFTSPDLNKVESFATSSFYMHKDLMSFTTLWPFFLQKINCFQAKFLHFHFSQTWVTDWSRTSITRVSSNVTTLSPSTDWAFIT